MRITLSVVLFFAAALVAQSAAPERQPYIFFSNLDTAETEQKINDLAADGYRLVGLQSSVSGANIVVMHDVASLVDTRYEYKLISGSWQKLINDKAPLPPKFTEAGAQGYRCFRGSLLFMLPETWVARPNERAIAMERERGSTATYEYRFSRAMMASNSMSDLQRGMHDGFMPIATYSLPGERELLMEKGTPETKTFDPGADRASKAGKEIQGILWPNLSGSSRTASLEISDITTRNLAEKLSQHTQSGMRLLVLSSGIVEHFGTVWASIPASPPQIFVTGELKHRRDDPRTVRSVGWDRVEQELNAAADKGYAISVRPMFVTKGNFALSEFTLHYLIPMDAVLGPKVHYKIIRAGTLPELSERVNVAAAEGWNFVPELLYGDTVVFLYKHEAEVKP